MWDLVQNAYDLFYFESILSLNIVQALFRK